MEGWPALPIGDYGDLMQMAFMGAVYLVASVLSRNTKTETETRSVTETVDEGVLGKFADLFERIGKLEIDLIQTKNELAEAAIAYQEALEEKEKEIKSLKTSLENHRRRIKELEDRLSEESK